MRQDRYRMCQASELNPTTDETVSPSMERKLRSRAEHFDWNTLWIGLFPEDRPENIPDPGGLRPSMAV